MIVRPDQLGPGHAAAMTTRLVPPDTEPFFPIQPVDPLAVHRPALPAKFDPDPLVAPRRMHAHDLADATAQRGLVVLTFT